MKPSEYRDIEVCGRPYRHRALAAYWHLHHRQLLGFSDQITKRMKYIVDYKPVRELPRRIKLLQLVRGKLPEDLMKAARRGDNATAAWLLRAYAPQIEALHKQECPHCPWNGRTIFPGRED